MTEQATQIESNWPEFHEELGRKTMNVVEQWTQRYQAGIISKREYFILISGLYDATIGLMEIGFSDLLAQIHQELRQPAHPAEQKAA